jgi:hypothetical protein
MTTKELMNADKIWQNEKSVFLSATAFNLTRHVMLHHKKYDTECHVEHLQSEVSSIAYAFQLYIQLPQAIPTILWSHYTRL